MKHVFDEPRRTAVLLEPYPLCQTALTALLAKFGLEVVGAATDTATAVTLLQEHRPDLLIAEVDLPEGREKGLGVIADARLDDPELTVIVFSAVNDRALIDAAFDNGAAAYVLKTSDPDVIATAVRQAFEPSLYLAPPREQRPVALAPAEPALLPKLTRRELEILQLVSEGRSNREVAKILWVTDQTVKFHLANVYRKLGVRSRFDAARWAVENGVLEVAESGEVVTLSDARGSRAPRESILVPLRPASPRTNGATERVGETSR